MGNGLYQFHVDPKRCDRFYSCYKRKATLKTCPMHRLYSATTRACALPMFVQCDNRVRPGRETTTSTTTTTTEATTVTIPSTTRAVPDSTPQIPDDEFKCPNGKHQYHADPKRCDRFYSCYKRIATLKTCPMHRLYSTTTRACALPMFVQCDNRVRPGRETT